MGNSRKSSKIMANASTANIWFLLMQTGVGRAVLPLGKEGH
jgi:hypothetical protein